MALSWFREVDPKYKDCIRRLLSTDCFDCFIDIVGWQSDRHADAFLTLGALSNHAPVWNETWQGRLHTAWLALRGRTRHEFEFNTREDVDRFIQHVQEVANETWPAPKCGKQVAYGNGMVYRCTRDRHDDGPCAMDLVGHVAA